MFHGVIQKNNTGTVFFRQGVVMKLWISLHTFYGPTPDVKGVYRNQ